MAHIMSKAKAMASASTRSPNGRFQMPPNRIWSSLAIWLSVMGLTLSCALVVIDLAFASSALALSADPSRIRADYSADPRAARAMVLAPIDAAVVADTLHDNAAERGAQLGPGVEQPQISPTSAAQTTRAPVVVATASIPSAPDTQINPPNATATIAPFSSAAAAPSAQPGSSISAPGATN